MPLRSLRSRLVLRSEASKLLTLKLYQIGLLGAAKQARFGTRSPKGKGCYTPKEYCTLTRRAMTSSRKSYNTVCLRSAASRCCADPEGTGPCTRRGDMALMNTMVIPHLYVKVFHLLSYVYSFFSCLWNFFSYFINFFISYAYYIFRLFFYYLFSCLCSLVYSFAKSHYLLS